MAASSIDCIFRVSRDHLDEGPKNTNELPRVCFAKVLKTKGCHEDGRQLESLHLSGPRAHLDGRQNALNKKLLS